MSEEVKEGIKVLSFRVNQKECGFAWLSKEKTKAILDYIDKQDKEIERLNNIINSLEQEMNEELKIESSGEDFVDGYDSCLKDFLQRLKELKQEN